MSTALGCPDLSQLELFALGRLSGPHGDAVEEHVSSCPHCAQALDTLPASDPLVDALRTASPGEPCPEVVVVLMRQLKKAHAQQTESFWGGAVPPAPDPLAFLEPAREPGELGWLGPYRVREVLGAGGMGVVFRAEDPRLKRAVALKVIKPELVARPGMRQRVVQEAQSVAAVEHENIVAIYEADEHGGVPYLAMPLLRGESLEQRLRQARGALGVEETLRIGREVAAGLTAAHQRGLVHRDIKPANIFLCAAQESPDRVKVLDFGLAQVRQEHEHDPVPQAGVAGTPAYMAPEQALGQPPQDVVCPAVVGSGRARGTKRPFRTRPRRGGQAAAPTCSASAACSTRWRRGGAPSRGRTSTPCCAASPRSSPSPRRRSPACPPTCRGLSCGCWPRNPKTGQPRPRR